MSYADAQEALPYDNVCVAPLAAGAAEEARMRAREVFGRSIWRLFAVGALLLVGFRTAPAQAATDVLYVSATGHYMRGVFRDFWDRNGGLANFGHPLTEEYIDPKTNR